MLKEMFYLIGISGTVLLSFFMLAAGLNSIFGM
jgi:hypothetical protein